MLLVHQEGAVKVGEVVRYTLTYTPSLDQKPASALYVRIKNTSAIPYRAAYLVGPYTVHVSAYPETFNPYKKLEDPRCDGVPQFEPNLKAGGHWHATLTIPDSVVNSRDTDKSSSGSYTWIIEVASQVLFSGGASVNFELLVAREERSLDTGFAALASRGHGEPGKVGDLIHYVDDGPGGHPTPKGVYSKAVRVIAEDTAQLWNKPELPHMQPSRNNKPKSNDAEPQANEDGRKPDTDTPKPRKKIHLVVLTHGLHSNVGADMLYMKESIDATVKQARQEARQRRMERRKAAKSQSDESGEVKADVEQETSTAPLSGGQEDLAGETEDDPDDEEVIVRGFSGNVVRTEKGIQYLGKRLAKYILTLTFPDQPFLPQAKSMTRSFSLSFPGSRQGSIATGSSGGHNFTPEELRPFQFTSISFIGHSLGGLIQLYAVGYIQKHSPEFFERIKPINFVTMAAPLLGLSNENPLYVKFALDFGLVGRTGQDLGLTWRAPTLARSGWNAMFSGFGGGGSGAEKEPRGKQEDPRSKPLLRILPSGPAHHVLKMFRNRTVYSNVVNDGIVPLRTSCLLFLDWRGLGRVDNARRENGLIGTMAQFGWAELTGANTVSYKPGSRSGVSMDSTNLDSDSGDNENSRTAPDDRRKEDVSKTPTSPAADQFLSQMHTASTPQGGSASITDQSGEEAPIDRPSSPASAFDKILDFIRPKEPKQKKGSKQSNRALTRGQTLKKESQQSGRGSLSDDQEPPQEKKPRRPLVTRGSSLKSNDAGGAAAPPKTSIFEAAGDILNPPIPTLSWLTDPSTRSRTIFHDRVYYPEDIPPPPHKKARGKLSKAPSSDSLRDPPRTPTTSGTSSPNVGLSPARSPGGRTRTERELGPEVDASGMKVEEKIARAYHRDLSWRKVLVRLEPDAHNNMIVRRMFANAYGWDVVRHLCDTHFADTYAARTGDEDEGGRDRARPADESTGKLGDMVEGQRSKEAPDEKEPDRLSPEGAKKAPARRPAGNRTSSEMREAADEVKELGSVPGATGRRLNHKDSFTWSDDIFEGTDDEWESGEEQQH